VVVGCVQVEASLTVSNVGKVVVGASDSPGWAPLADSDISVQSDPDNRALEEALTVSTAL